MKGTNTITINHSTMLVALQRYIDDEFKDAPIVTGVLVGGIAPNTEYTITVMSKQENFKRILTEGKD